MTIAFGVSWNRHEKPRPAIMLALVSVVLVASIGVAIGAGTLSSVIVLRAPGSGPAAAEAVEDAGGHVVRELGIVNGFAAEIPQRELARIAASRGVAGITPNAPVHPLHSVDGFDASKASNSMYGTTLTTGAQAYWEAGFYGKGVDIALIDTGVASPISGLNGIKKVTNGADLSFDSQSPTLRYQDAFGHGTHMAGIIAGKDDRVGNNSKSYFAHDDFVGMAPDARVMSVKVGDAQGATDVSQVIAAIDWVVQHRRDDGMNIRVLNLSFGTQSTQAYSVDPLAYAAEVAWRSGIVVVAAAGNSGTAGLTSPAYDPNIIAVGSLDTNGTTSRNDDRVSSFSSVGGTRGPDLVAPGRSVASLRVPGSFIDESHPEARTGSRYFRGSGTSQAAAVVSGAAALILEQRPDLTPNQVKALLRANTHPIPGGASAVGSGALALDKVLTAPVPVTTQVNVWSTGLGTLESSRGGNNLTRDGVTLRGEKDIFGASYSAASWAPAALAGSSWSGGTWNGNTWSGSSWSGSSWSGSTWSGSSWSGSTWSGSSWSGNTWNGSTWSGSSWRTGSWLGSTWRSSFWAGARWS